MNNSGLERVQMEEDEPEIILCGSAVYNYLGIAESQLDKCENPRILTVLSSLLERAVIRNDTIAATVNNSNNNHSICRKKLSIFHGLRAPSIGIHSYIMRIFKYAKCSPSCFVMAYAYIIKLTASQAVGGSSMITSLNVHRLLITCVMVATKFIDDRHYNNAYYAKIGGVSTVEMNGLESALLGSLGYRLHVSMSAFESFCADFGKEAAMQAVLVGRPDRPLIAAVNCSFDEEQSRKEALLCINYGGV